MIKDLPFREIHCELSEEERQCNQCDEQMKPMGKKIMREEVCFIPAKLYKKVYVCHSYECNCHDPSYEAKQIKSGIVPKGPIQNSLASASVLAFLMHQKYVLSLPLYRQEAEWKRYGLKVPRRTLANWVITPTQDWLYPIYQCIHRYLLLNEVIHGDETPYQILNRSDGKAATSDSRMWIFRTTHQAKRPIVMYHADLTRKQTVAQGILKGFKGYIQSDGYQAYKNIDNCVDVGCWAHVRRKFFEVPKGGQASVGVSHCDEMFKVERGLKDLPPEQRHQKRQTLLKPLIEKFYEWLGNLRPMKGKFGEAIIYALNQKASLMRILLDGRLQLSNNLAEQKMRNIAIGRKNYLFSASEAGAQANAIVYTIVETAKENGIDPFNYLNFLFEKLPNINFSRNPKLLEDFLPWTDNIKNNCLPKDNIKSSEVLSFN